MLGLIPEFRVICAAKAAGYRYYHDWQELAWEHKALLVAHYLADIMILNHSEDAKAKAIKRQQRKSAAKGKK